MSSLQEDTNNIVESCWISGFWKFFLGWIVIIGLIFSLALLILIPFSESNKKNEIYLGVFTTDNRESKIIISEDSLNIFLGEEIQLMIMNKFLDRQDSLTRATTEYKGSKEYNFNNARRRKSK